MSNRDKIQMTEEELDRYLKDGHTVMLVTNGPNGYPHAMPMFYGLDADHTFRFSTYETSQKVRNIKRNPQVTLLLESGSEYDQLKGVMIEARAEISRDLDATVDTMVEAMGRTANEMPPASTLPEDVKKKMAGKRVLVRVVPERFISWDHGKLADNETPKGLQENA
jgi:PPOX class probable F420-dependent enzyme